MICFLVIFSYKTVQGVSVITCGLHQQAEFECTLDFIPLGEFNIAWIINNELYRGNTTTPDGRILHLHCTEELDNSTIQCVKRNIIDPNVPDVPGDVFYVQIQGK